MRRLKKISVMIGCLIMGCSTLQAGTITKVYLNGQKVFMKELPSSKNGTTYVNVDAMEKALGVEISNSVKTMAVREVADKVGATLEFDKVANAINFNYKLNGELDQWGRLTRTTNLPKNKASYTYFVNSVPNGLYESPFSYDRCEWKIKPVEGTHYIKPVNMGKFLNYFTKENIDLWMSKASKNLDLRLNVDYKNVNEKWLNELVKTYPEYQREERTKDIKRYMSYIKNNKLQVIGDYYAEPSTFYEEMGGYYVKCYVKFMVKSPKNMKVHLYQECEYDNIKTNTWYQGYIDIGLSTNICSEYDNELWVTEDGVTFDVKES